LGSLGLMSAMLLSNYMSSGCSSTMTVRYNYIAFSFGDVYTRKKEGDLNKTAKAGADH
jgi:hypothetical protein